VSGNTPKPLPRTARIIGALLAGPARYAQVLYLTAPAARPVVTRAAAGVPAGQQDRIVIRDLPPAAFTPEGGLYAERTRAEAQLAALRTTTPAQDNDPTLLDEPPAATAVIADAPDRIKAALIDTFGIQALYNKDMNQVTIWASCPAPLRMALCSGGSVI